MARVVENGKQCNDLHLRTSLVRQSQSVFKDSGPMGNTVSAAVRQGVTFEDVLQDYRDVEFHVATSPRP